LADQPTKSKLSTCSCDGDPTYSVPFWWVNGGSNKRNQGNASSTLIKTLVVYFIKIFLW